MTESRRTALHYILLIAVLTITYFTYANGLTGAPHFDDTPNLQGLASVHDINSAMLFVFSGNAGPLGRPIALATFALQAHSWIADFKELIKVNILIHILNTVLVTWFALRLYRALSEQTRNEIPFAVTVTALWALHPLLISSSLIVIQRMTTLSATFMLAGFIAYLSCRQNLKRNKISTLAIILIVVIFVTLLAGLTKETGLLFPVYLWILEFTIFSNEKKCRLHKLWGLLLAIPVAALILYLASFVPHASEASPRGFNAWQRLLAEGPILFTYIKLILIPTPNSLGPFHDDILVPTDLPNILIAFSAWTAIIIAIAYAVLLRRKTPIISFSILWFFVGLSLESTLPSLELYFEHRNYIPILGPIILVSSLVCLGKGRFRSLLRLAFPVYIAIFCFVANEVTSAWGNPALSAELWSLEHPQSERAYQFLAQRYIAIGRPEKAMQVITSGYDRLPNSAGLALQSLQLSCSMNRDIGSNTEDLLPSLKSSTQNYAAVDAIKTLLDINKNGDCKGLTNEFLHKVIDAILSNSNFRNNPRISFNLHQFKSLLYFQQRELDPAVRHLETAFSISPDIDTASLIVYYLTTAGLTDEALKSIAWFSTALPRNPLLRAQWDSRLQAMKDEISRRLGSQSKSTHPTNRAFSV